MKKVKKYPESGHKVKSEIIKPNGAWTKEGIELSIDTKKAIKRLMKKHKGKMSTISMFSVFSHVAYMETSFATAFSTKFLK